ncbi:fungal-specific transcription factor domain-containing protein [Paraphoma chrysanthemicola]|uniref:Fungal-specific transcription factor domain-containing protein n=1 Tax=Paraphoma chrysanthemicola TaxID=798071 RepID=A0A8K0W1L0_9PLEO|nr:fungal-specific transcription factor domain-containing protein [Paraphoma chrysanthemicola]
MSSSQPADSQLLAKSYEKAQFAGLKVIIACDRCRAKKVKCDGARPCESCVDHRIECHYSRTTRRHRGSSKDKIKRLQQRLDDAERLLRTFGAPDWVASGHLSLPNNEGIGLRARSHTGNHTHHPSQAGDELAEVQYQDSRPRDASPRIQSRDSSSYACLPTPSSSNVAGEAAPLILEATTATAPVTCHDITGATDCDAVPSNQSACILSHENTEVERELPQSRDEIHGPNSYLSICADPGVDWIASRIGSSNFTTCASSLMSNLDQRMKLRKKLGKERISEPPTDLAWVYTRAYFEESLEATYNTIDRVDFEERLRKTYAIGGESDAGWYALRNAVFATGCRIMTFKTCTWRDAQTQSQGYFENALAVEAELIHGTPGIVGIQALLVMAFFCEGAGSAKLEYTLIGCAARLAHARGLHLRPVSSKLTFEERQRRSWIFWSIYMIEKHLTLRSGRPSIIDDDDISCEMPTWAPNANSNLVECMQQTIKQSMLSSSIAKNFLTVKAREKGLIEKVKIIRDFDSRLRSWFDELPTIFKVEPLIQLERLPRGLRYEHLMYLHLTYYGNLAAIHSVLGYPWNVDLEPILGSDASAIQDQIISSDEGLTEASRNIIMVTRSIMVDASAPVWLVFYYPVLATINLFISILKAKSSESKDNKLGLMDMAAGYFAFLDLSTDSSFSFSLVQNLAQWARQAVAKADSRPISNEGSLFTPASAEEMMPMLPDYTTSISDLGGCDIDGMDLGDWPAFLPRMPQFSAWT